MSRAIFTSPSGEVETAQVRPFAGHARFRVRGPRSQFEDSPLTRSREERSLASPEGEAGACLVVSLNASDIRFMPRESDFRIDPDELLKAYTLGYFPMARSRHDAAPVWVLPEARGVLPLEEATAPKRLIRTLKQERFDVRIDTKFADVIAACARRAKGREDTWINAPIEQVYLELHRAEFAHSVECWREGTLVGGLYGVALGAIFCGESMFSLERDASKIALLHLIARLRMTGFKLLDAQFHTPHLAQFGVRECPDTEYQALLGALVPIRADFAAAPAQLSTRSVLQSITQTS